MQTIERYKNPQETITNTTPVEMDNPIPGQNTTHEVVTPAGHGLKDQKRDKHGMSPVSLGSAKGMSNE